MRVFSLVAWVVALILAGLAWGSFGEARVRTFEFKKLKVLGIAEPEKNCLYSLDLVTGERKTILSGLGRLGSVRVSPTQKAIYFTSLSPFGVRLGRAELDGSMPRSVLTLEPGAVDVAVSPDGQKVCYERSAGGSREPTELVLYDVATRRVSVLCGVGPRFVLGEASFRPDGQRVAFWIDHRLHAKLYEIDLVKGGLPVPVVSFPGHQRTPLYSGDGRFLMFGSDHLEHPGYTWIVCDPILHRVVAMSATSLPPGDRAQFCTSDTVVEEMSSDARQSRFTVHRLDGAIGSRQLVTETFMMVGVLEYEGGRG